MSKEKFLYDSLKHIFPNSIGVLNPDHPFIFQTPDILFAENNRLIGVFIPTIPEKKDPDKLLVRLSMSRLALPKHLICILMQDRNDSHYGNESIIRNFHACLDMKEITAIKDLVYSNKMPDYIKPIPNDIKERKYSRAQLFYNNSLNLLKNKLNQSNKLKKYDLDTPKVNSWFDRGIEKKVSRNIYRYKDSIIADGLEKIFNEQQIDTLTTFSTLSDYDLDTGIPYPRKEGFNFININELPVHGTDPYKIVRCLTYSGWMFVNVEQIEQVNTISERIKSIYG